MNFSSMSIRHPVPVIVLFILLSLGGLIGYHGMKIQDSPDVEFPVIFVHTSLPGASPPQLESTVARRVENALAGIEGVRHLASTISDGIVATKIEFELSRDSTEAINEVRDAMGRVRGDLPAEVRDPVITKLNVTGAPILGYTVSSAQLDVAQLSWFVDDKVARSLMSVRGVGRVARVGGVDREILVELDPARLTALNVSAADISQQLQRVQQEASGGRADIGGEQQSVRTIATARSVQDIAAMEMALPDGRRIRLDRIARVSDATAEPRAATLLDGKPVVGFEISRSKGASDIEVAEAVRATLAKLGASERQVVLKEIFNTSDTVRSDFDGSMSLLYEGALLAVLVVWVFLRAWRATLVAAVALPLSVLPTFLVIHMLGFTLNMVTLLALALVIGVLVDDAIVEIENIMRHLRQGRTPLQAAREAADEIGLAVVATTLTLVAVFLPTAFMTGFVGEYFRQFGWTAAIAVGASLLVARLLTPMMAAYLLRPMVQRDKEGRLMRAYLAAAGWCLRHRRATMLSATVLFILSLSVVAFLPTGFIPAPDRGQTQVTLELVPGSTLAETRASAELARRLVRQDADITQVYASIGGDEVRRAILTLKLKPLKERARTVEAIDRGLRERLAVLPAVRVTVGYGDDGEELTIPLAGEDPEVLKSAALRLQREIRGIPGLGAIYSNISVVRPELIVTPDFARAADLGVTAAAIGDTLRVATAGDYEQVLPKLNLSDRQIPIRVRLPDQARSNLGLLERLPVPGKNGNVALGTVASLRIDSGPVRIDRYDRQRRVTIHVELNGRDEEAVRAALRKLPALTQLPQGVVRATSGGDEMKQELFSSFIVAMLTGILCVYLVLVLLFKSFMQPLTIMAALPLSIGGAFAALLVTNHALSLPSLLGMLMLMGVTVKNSILLVEYALRARREHGVSRRDALIDACRKRAQPIVMTTVAMGAGMLPIALGIGADAAFRAPMAIAVIGGLLTSTLLSLLVIPVVFTYLDDLAAWRIRWFRRRGAASAVAQPLLHEVT